MQDLSEVLSQLRDIHEPEPVSWWPPAPAWWVLAVLLLAAIFVIFYLLKRYKNSFRRAAKRELDKIVRDFNIHHDDERLLKDFSVFLRRVAIKKNSKEVAGLTGSSWLNYLDELSEYKAFNGDYADILVSGPYQENIEFDSKGLISEIQRWVLKLK